MSDVAKLVTPEIISEFERDGSVKIPRAITEMQLSDLAKAFDELALVANDATDYYQDEPGLNGSRGLSLTRGENWRTSRLFRDFMFNSILPEMAARITRSRSVQVFEDLLIYRSQGADRPTPWHQDTAQTPMSGQQQCSIWFSLESLTPEDGSLRFVNASHKGPTYIPYVPESQRGNLEPDMRFFDGGPIPDVDRNPDRFPIKAYDVEPGDVIVFHPQSLHSARGAPLDHARRTFSIRFAGDDVRYEPKVCAFHQWIRDLTLQSGDRLEGDYFPVLWSARETSDLPVT